MPPRVQQLRERGTTADVAIAEVGASTRVRDSLRRLGAKRLIDGGEQRVSDALVDEEAHAREHDRHRDCEGEREPQPDR